jgi:hypothetical protein
VVIKIDGGKGQIKLAVGSFGNFLTRSKNSAGLR